MLNIYFGDMEDVIYNTSMYFDNTYLDNWIMDDFSKEIIKSVDNAVVIGAQAVDSEALGVVPVTKLSGGTKTLLLLYKCPELILNASTCGDNCAKWILKIAEFSKQDITINLYHLMNFGDDEFEIKILNNNVVVHNMKELVLQGGMYLRGIIE